ncbi:hypothetical protein [Caulobacter sp. 17J80-11]|uniref:hypothetical protein n=1 Tax=Caulobacter sp. 17J80-11 TaxID=2763502 RepID=UPI001653B17D|nr:hypothetical protein [Caulobacter sp. 17J80-11]MBC6981437.1 hypothetical protein [Caulobacter sp. 17J80-11]
MSLRRLQAFLSGYAGLWTFTGGVALSGAALVVAMVLFRAEAEPIVRFALPLLMSVGRHRHGHSHYRYEEDHYGFVIGFIVVTTVVFVGLLIWGIAGKPESDRRLERHLEAQLEQSMRRSTRSIDDLR